MISKVRLIAIGTVLAITTATAVNVTHKYTKFKYENKLLEYQNELQTKSLALAELNRDKERLHLELQNQIAKSDALRKQKQEVIVKTNTIEVIKYAESDIAKCEHSTDWVRIHDTAAENSVPADADTTAKSNDSPSGITDADSLAVIVENYGTCNSIREQLILLQEWAGAIQ